VTGLNNDSKSDLAHHRADVYHRAFDIILDDLKVPAHHGTFVLSSANLIKGVPVLATASADYEEM
jgi:hypothetical protein